MMYLREQLTIIKLELNTLKLLSLFESFKFYGSVFWIQLVNQENEFDCKYLINHRNALKIADSICQKTQTLFNFKSTHNALTFQTNQITQKLFTFNFRTFELLILILNLWKSKFDPIESKTIDLLYNNYINI
jgi:hypothetical protein